MTHNLLIDITPPTDAPPRTRADLCRLIADTSGLPTTAHITFTLSRGKVRAVGVEVAL